MLTNRLNIFLKKRLHASKVFILQNPKRSIVLSILVILAIVFLFNIFSNDPDTEINNVANAPVVKITSIADLRNDGSFSVVGEIKNTDEALLTTQTAGRIKRVYGSIGETMFPGQVVLELENSSERAALRQAEASLQQTIANAKSSEVSIAEAKDTLRRAEENANSIILEAFSTTERIIFGTVDKFFSNPEEGLIGARIGGGAVVGQLNNQRRSLRSILNNWRTLHTGTESKVIINNLEQATSYSYTTLELVQTILEALQSEDTGGLYSTGEIITLRTDVAKARELILGLQEKIRTVRNNLQTSIQALEKANLQSDPGTNSASQANIAQAEAGVQSARSNLNKTIIFSPVRGTLTDFSATVGQFVNSGTQIGKVYAPGSLYVQAFINEKEKNLLQIGQVVQVGQQATGTLSYISPNVNSTNGKYELRVTVEDDQFSTGSSVVASFISTEKNDDTKQTTFLPVTAIQFNGNDAQILSINEDDQTYSIPVELGETKGSSIEIITELAPELYVIIDARGIKVDEMIEVEK